MSGIGFPEILIIAFLILLFFGGKKLPELTRGLTEAIRQFREGAKEDNSGAKKKANS